jgi:ABC-type phosphate transport system substrate-binding protein
MYKQLLASACLALFSVCSHAQVAVVMAPSAAPLTKDQVAAVFLGRNADFKPIDLPEASATRNTFYQKATDRDASQVKAVWARLVFSGKAQPPKELPDAAAVKKAVAADPKAIGYISAADVDTSVKVIFQTD